jgi:hypothetical protein
MFSAFKGPFEERIEEWNRKLLSVSDLLDVWKKGLGVVPFHRYLDSD